MKNSKRPVIRQTDANSRRGFVVSGKLPDSGQFKIYVVTRQDAESVRAAVERGVMPSSLSNMLKVVDWPFCRWSG